MPYNMQIVSWPQITVTSLHLIYKCSVNDWLIDCVRSCRLDRDAVVLHIAVVCSTVGRLHSDVRSSRIPLQRSPRHRNLDPQPRWVVVRADAWVVFPDAQRHVRHRLEPHLHGVVAGHRRLFPEGPQVPRAGDQHPALRISHRSV